jgi:hypothetical protein
LWNSAGSALVDCIAALITDNLTSEQILSEDYSRIADHPEVGWATHYKRVYRN